jgi:hypothetical protein
MGLPKIDIPTQTVVLPSDKRELVVRPFLVKEEKILLTAIQSGESKDIVHATKQVIQNCIITQGVDVDKLPMYDLEYLILQLRIMSIGNTLSLKVSPIEDSTCEECKAGRDIEVDLSTAEVIFNPNHQHKIELTNTVGVILKDPSAKLMDSFDKVSQTNSAESLFKLIWMCIESVYDESTVTSAKDVSEKEGIEFLESLNAQQFGKIDAFFKTLPKLSLPIKIKCGKCDFEDEQVLERLETFFG